MDFFFDLLKRRSVRFIFSHEMLFFLRIFQAREEVS
jgi:hypothetical protein